MAKIKISCTKEQKENFCNSSCPEQFDGHLPGLMDCIEKDYNKLCEDCWAQYVDWETEKGETASSPILVGDGYSDGESVYDYWHCPKCDQAHDIDDKYNYCPTCGQRIYWENEKGELNG